MGKVVHHLFKQTALSLPGACYHHWLIARFLQKGHKFWNVVAATNLHHAAPYAKDVQIVCNLIQEVADAWLGLGHEAADAGGASPGVATSHVSSTGQFFYPPTNAFIFSETCSRCRERKHVTT
jgi:hypothetical protein